MKSDAAIRALHANYVGLTGMDVALTLPRMYAWEAWQARGFTMKDLAAVIRLRAIKARDRQRGPALGFHGMIEDLDRFEEDAAEARARNRKRVYPPGKRAVLKSTSRPSEPEHPDARTLDQIIAGERALDELRKLRDSL
jgi:hypothetical protein